MGTTLTALEADNAVSLRWVLTIEGFEYLITNGDLAAVVTAWAGSGWSQALPGLKVTGNISQKWQPFGNDLSVGSITCQVQSDDDDIFGKAVFKSKPSFRAELTSDFGPGDTTINVKNTSALGSSGTVYIGGKSYSFSGKTSSTLTGVASTLAPLDTDTLGTGKFPGVHSATSSSSIDSPVKAKPPDITDVPRQWVGRQAALYLVRDVDGVYDVKAQAHLMIAGQLADVYDAGTGNTTLIIEDFRRKIADTTLLQDQWTATPVKGYYLGAGIEFYAKLFTWDSATTTFNEVEPVANLTVGTASGTDQIDAGRYSAAELASKINAWLNGDANLAHATTGAVWSAGISQDETGTTFRMNADLNTASLSCHFTLECTNKKPLELLGFGDSPGKADDMYRVASGRLRAAENTLSAIGPPMVIESILDFVGNSILDKIAGGARIDLESGSESGTFHDLTSYLPSYFKVEAEAGEVWSVFTINDRFTFLGRKASATLIDKIRVLDMFPNDSFSDNRTGVPATALGSDAPRVRQVLIVAGTLLDVLTKLIASTDGAGVNHATYDALPFGAGIPWGVLGNGWTSSVKDVAQANVTDSVCVVIEKPTSLWDAISIELAMRVAFIVWKSGGLQLASYQTPNASTADFTLSEATKGLSPGSKSTSESRLSQEWLTNNVKIKFNRSIAEPDKYKNEVVVRDVESIESYGLAKAKTFKARNSYAGISATGVAVEDLATMIAAVVMPPFGRPVRIVRLATNHNLINMTPGDVVAFSDNFVRDPTTGAYGISARGGFVIETSGTVGISAGPGQMNFSATILYTEEERTFPVSPCAEHDETYTSGSYTDGWNSSGLLLATKRWQHSGSGDSDSLSFSAGDEVTIMEIDPADPASADVFDDVVAASYGTAPYPIELTTGFGAGGNPAFSASKIYRIVPAKYADADAGQRVTAFIADNADDLIQDLIDPNQLGAFQIAGANDYDLTDLPPLHADESFEEGRPFHSGLIQDVAQMSNNLHNHKLKHRFSPNNGGDTSWGSAQVVQVIPINISMLQPRGDRKLIARIGVTMCATSGTAELDVYSSGEPPGGTYPSPTFPGANNMLTFSTATTTPWVNTAVQEVELVRSERYPGFSFLTLDNPGTGGLRFNGLHTLEVLDWDQS